MSIYSRFGHAPETSSGVGKFGPSWKKKVDSDGTDQQHAKSKRVAFRAD
jgi:hypothetical protein